MAKKNQRGAPKSHHTPRSAQSGAPSPAKLLFQLIQCLHHLFNATTQANGTAPKAFASKIGELGRFVKPAQTNQWVQDQILNAGNVWCRMIGHALAEHYEVRISNILKTLKNLDISDKDWASSKATSLGWAGRNFGKKLQQKTVDRFLTEINKCRQSQQGPQVVVAPIHTPHQTVTPSRPSGPQTPVRSSPDSVMSRQDATPSTQSPSLRLHLTPTPDKKSQRVAPPSQSPSPQPGPSHRITPPPSAGVSYSKVLTSPPPYLPPTPPINLRPNGTGPAGQRISPPPITSHRIQPRNLVNYLPTRRRKRTESWAIPEPRSDILVLGTSNIARITANNRADVQLESFSGANMFDFKKLLQSAPCSTRPHTVIMAGGLNDRDNCQETNSRRVREMISECRRTFPQSRIVVPLVNYDNNLPLSSKKGVDYINTTILRQNVQTIPKIPDDKMVTDRNDRYHPFIHWTAPCANYILQHWLSSLN